MNLEITSSWTCSCKLVTFCFPTCGNNCLPWFNNLTYQNTAAFLECLFISKLYNKFSCIRCFPSLLFFFCWNKFLLLRFVWCVFFFFFFWKATHNALGENGSCIASIRFLYFSRKGERARVRHVTNTTFHNFFSVTITFDSVKAPSWFQQ